MPFRPLYSIFSLSTSEVSVEIESREKLKSMMAREQEEKTKSLVRPLIHVTDEEDGKGVLGSVPNNKLDEFMVEVKKQVWLAGPMLAVNVMTFCICTISVMFVGHVSELALAGASMASSFASVTGFSLVIGGGYALDTFCGPSYGAKQYHMLGIHMQRAMLVLLLVCIPLSCLWVNAGDILEFLGQDRAISLEAGVYARYMIPSIFAYALMQCQIRFLQSQNNVVHMMFTTAFTTLLHVFICWILVCKSGLGSRGAALANGISYWINVILLAVYIRFSSCNNKTWNGFSKMALRDIPAFIRVAIPSAMMVCIEMWSFEMMVLLAGLLPNPTLQTSVLSISLNTQAMLLMIPLGVGGAVSTRVSNELGAGQPEGARTAVGVAISMVAIETIFVATIMILCRKIWGYCYSKEERVVNYVGEMMFLLAATHICDGVQSVVNGVARGCGWQKIGAIVNFGAYYLIGIPFGILLAFGFQFGGKGLWTGIVVAEFLQALILFVVTVCTNWEKEAEKASVRIHDLVV